MVQPPATGRDKAKTKRALYYICVILYVAGALFGNHSTAAGRRYRAEDLTRVTPKFTYISNIHTPAKDIRLANITCEYRNYRNFGTLSAVRLSGV